MIITSSNGKPIVIDANLADTLLSYKWTINRNGYAECFNGGDILLMHRLLMKVVKGQIVDHINGNKADIGWKT